MPAGKFSHVIFICKDQWRRDKVQKLLASTQPEATNIIFIGPDNIVAALERVDPVPQTAETTILGYKVKVSRQSLSASDLTVRRQAVAEVIARPISKGQ